MKPFDLKLALEGYEIIDTYSFDKGKYVFTNKHRGGGTKHFFQFSINDGMDQAVVYYAEEENKFRGCFSGREHPDYMMAPINREVWVNLYQDEKGLFYVGQGLYSNESGALDVGTLSRHKYIKSIKIHEYVE